MSDSERTSENDQLLEQLDPNLQAGGPCLVGRSSPMALAGGSCGVQVGSEQLAKDRGFYS